MLDDAAVLPMFPLSTVLFPNAELPLHVFEPRYRELVRDAQTAGGTFGTVLISAGAEVGGGDKRCAVGTMLHIEMVVPFDDGRSLVVVKGVERIEVLEWLEDAPYPRARIAPLPCAEDAEPVLLERAAGAVRRVRMLLSELDDGPCSTIAVDLVGDTAIDSWMVCALAPLGLFDLQRVLEQPSTSARLELLTELCCERIGDLQRLLSDPGA